MQRCILLAIFVLAAMSVSVQPSYASVGCTTDLANCYQRAAGVTASGTGGQPDWTASSTSSNAHASS